MGVVFLVGSGFVWFRLSEERPAEAVETETKTAIVRRGDLVISATGVGNVIEGDQMGLAFSVSGTLEDLYVKVGDRVEAGDLLAVLQDDPQMFAAVTSDELDLLTAQKELDELNKNSNMVLAEAEVALVEAQNVYDDALQEREKMNYNRCDDDTVDEYYIILEEAQDKMEAAEAAYDGTTQKFNQLVSARNDHDTAYANYYYCANHFSEEEIATADADLSLASANLEAADDNLAVLIEQKGVDPLDAALAEAKIANAEANLAVSKGNLEGMQLVAPMDGTIMSIDVIVGESVGTSEIVQLADLSRHILEVYLDEMDMDNVAVGYEVEVYFDAIPDRVFMGIITSVDPALVTVSGVEVIQGLVELDLASLDSSQNLPVGLNASVDVIGGRAENVLLVPLEALRELSPGEYAVFVMENDEMNMRLVEVGLMDYTYAEIISGLEAGDVVTTGIVETN